jgi:murein DD-endopeptidase MepM/ murein hydrolase activator NlpD
MNTLHRRLIALVACLLCVGLMDSAYAQSEQSYVIHFQPNTPLEAQNAYLAQANAALLESIPQLSAVVVRAPAEPAPSPLVALVERDALLSAQQTQGEPLQGRQYALPIMGVPAAWATLTNAYTPVAVALLDGDVCAEHVELRGKLLPGADIRAAFPPPTSSVIEGAAGHGCAMAGIIAADGSNSEGMAGIAPNARILPLRILNEAGYGYASAAARALLLAVDYGATLIYIGAGAPDRSVLLERAIDAVVQRGALVIAPAGNTGAQTLHPASYLPVVAVGALDTSLRVSAYTPRDAHLDLFTPAENILTTLPDGGYGFVNGTSVAGAQVVGLMALQMAFGRAPDFSQINGVAVFSAPPRDLTVIEIYYDEVYPIDEALRAPVRRTLEANRASLPPEIRYVVSAYREESDWVKITLVPPIFVSDVPARELHRIQPYIVELIGQRDAAGDWQLHMIGSPALEAISARIPRSVVDLFSPLPFMAGAYQFPWQSGQTWWAIDGWHDGNALDFQPRLSVGFGVLAAESGRLRELCYDGWQSLLQIEHADGEQTYYLHLTMPPALRRDILDQNVTRGTYLGELYGDADGGAYTTPCGAGLSRHLHFGVSDRALIVDGYALEDIAAVASCCAAPPEYVSSNLQGN